MTEISSKKQAALRILQEDKDDLAIVREFFKVAKGLDILDPLKISGWFEPSEVPNPVYAENGTSYSLPYWFALDYLKRTAKECSDVNDLSSADSILRIMRDVTEKISIEGKKNHHVWDGFAEIIGELPVEAIKPIDISQINKWLSWSGYTGLSVSSLGSNLLGNLIKSDLSKSEELTIILLEQLTSFEVNSQKEHRVSLTDQPKFVADNFWVKDILTKKSPELGLVFGFSVIQCISKRLDAWCDEQEKKDLPSYYWRAAIEEHAQNKTHVSNTSNILLVALRDTVQSWLDNNKQEVPNLLCFLFSQERAIFRRLAIYFSNVFYPYGQGKIWDLSLTELTSHETTHEFYRFLSDRFELFSETKKEEIFQFISTIEVLVGDLEKRDAYEKSQKLRWLSSIKGKAFLAADTLYGELVSETGYEHENPDFLMYFSTSWEGEHSSIDVATILSMDIPEIVVYLNEFRPTNDWGSPTARGLKEVLQEACKQDPEKFMGSMDSFSDCFPIYWSGLVHGLLAGWKEERADFDFKWEQIFEFIQARFMEYGDWYTNADQVGNGVYESWENVGFLRAVMRLITGVVDNDDNAIPFEFMPKLKSLIVSALDFVDMSKPRESDDLLNSAINEPRGYVIGALISYSLHTSRVLMEETGSHAIAWSDIKGVFDAELAKCNNQNYEFSAIITSRISNMMFLSRQWMLDNAEELFNAENGINWKAALDGYTYYGGSVSSFEDLLWGLGVFRNALVTFPQKGRVRDNLIERLSIGYLWGKQDLLSDNSDFSMVLRDFKFEDISHVIWFFWSSREGNMDNRYVQERIFKFWELCLSKLGSGEVNDRKLLSDINLLSAYITELDQVKVEWLSKSAEFVHENYHSPYLVEDLCRLVDEYPAEVGAVYLEMLKGYKPTYPEEKIRQIVKTLGVKGKLVIATEINNVYMRAGGIDYLNT